MLRAAVVIVLGATLALASASLASAQSTGSTTYTAKSAAGRIGTLTVTPTGTNLDVRNSLDQPVPGNLMVLTLTNLDTGATRTIQFEERFPSGRYRLDVVITTRFGAGRFARDTLTFEEVRI